MNNKVLFGIGLVLVLGLAGYTVFVNIQTANAPQTTETIQQEVTTEGEPSMPSLSDIEGKSLISIKDYTFSPSEITVKPGETVYVTNSDTVIHTATSDEAGLFDSGMVGTDEVKSFTAPTTPREYSFHCTPHPNMNGTLIVAE